MSRRGRSKHTAGTYFIAKAHPTLPETESNDYTGPWFNRDDKIRQIDRLYEENPLEIPIGLDHRDADKFGLIKENDVLGRVIDLFTNKDQELMVKFEIFDDHHEKYKELNQQLCYNKKLNWGISVGIMITRNEDGSLFKNLAHIALTTDPYFSDYNTYISHWHTNEDILNAVIDKSFIKDADYVTEAFQEKIKASLSSRILALLKKEEKAQDSMSNNNKSTEPVDMINEEEMNAEIEQNETLQGKGEEGGSNETTEQTVAPFEYSGHRASDIDDIVALKRELQRRTEHLKKNKVDLLDPSNSDVLEQLSELKLKIRSKTKAQLDDLARLKKDGFMDAETEDELRKLVGTDVSEALPLQKTFMTYAAANKQSAEKAIAQERLEKEAMKRKYEEQLATLQKQSDGSQKKQRGASYEEERQVAVFTPKSTSGSFKPNSLSNNNQQQLTAPLSPEASFIKQRAGVFTQVMDAPQYQKHLVPQVTAYYEAPQYKVDPDIANYFSQYNGVTKSKEVSPGKWVRY